MERGAVHRLSATGSCRLRCRNSGVAYDARIESLSRSAAVVAVTGELPARGLPAVGERVVIDVQLPASQHFARKCLRCFGEVVRVINDGREAPELALSLAHMAFQDVEQQAEGEWHGETWCDA